MMKTFLIAVTGLVATIAAPAFAQDRTPFAGPHIDAVLGYDRLQGGDAHDGGMLYGAGAGWDFDLGRGMRVGVEGEAAGSTQKECVDFGATSACGRAGRDLYVGGRVGALVGSGTLAYAKAGYTNARFGSRFEDAAGVVSRNHVTLDGVRLGVGIEHMLTRKISAKAEYRYSNYERGAERHQIVTGVSYRF